MEDVQRIAQTPIPRFYRDEPTCGGEMKAEPEHFRVTEEPLYEASGDGDHLFVYVTKRDLDHESMLRTLVKRLDVARSEIGYAGTKDRRAITKQWLSVPRRAEDKLYDFEHPQITMGESRPHPHKLRRGHLKANRFECFLKGATSLPSDALLEKLQSDGVPNFYDAQRFGRGGSTAIAGLRYLRGEVEEVSSRSLLRMQLSAVQSLGFNHVLRHRISEGLLQTPMLGDLAQVRLSGGIFWVDDLEDVSLRLREGDVDLTGPMLGAKVKATRDAAGEFESLRLGELGLRPELFAGLKKLAPGSRRPLTVRASELEIKQQEDGIWVSFSLLPGAYATLILREFTGTSVELNGPA